jgi:hypothetical protein
MKQKFNPLLFQASLSAGGVALMPFNYLQFTVPHGKGLIRWSDIVWQNMSLSELVLNIPMVLIMLLFVIVHFGLTLYFLAGLLPWLGNRAEFSSYINNPKINTNLFAVIASLSMSANVFWGPAGFFVPHISTNLQMYLSISLIFFAMLWLALFTAEVKIIKAWITKPLDLSQFSFTWLMDAFAFALVNLTGTGIAASSQNPTVASLAAFGSIFSLVVGSFILLVKLGILVYLQLKAAHLPDKAVIPSFFIVIPITCLLGLSYYRIASYAQTHFNLSLGGLSFFLVNFAYVFTITWGIAALIVLSSYFRHDFKNAPFSAPQWGLVCALVGSQVLGVYVYGFYFKQLILSSVNYASTLAAVLIYFFVMSKFIRSLKTQSQKA